jgi:hypothetical protein
MFRVGVANQVGDVISIKVVDGDATVESGAVVGGAEVIVVDESGTASRDAPHAATTAAKATTRRQTTNLRLHRTFIVSPSPQRRPENQGLLQRTATSARGLPLPSGRTPASNFGP